MKISTKLTNYLKNLRSTQVSPNLRIPQGVQVEASFSASRIKVPGLLTSFGRHQSSKILAPALTFALTIFGISLFSQTAYAASYINVSSGSGGTISFDSIKPSSAGVSASASDTLTITTNCSAGYKVYVSGQENGDTNLTNSSASSNNTISASSTAVGSAATTLNSNTWGITGDSANASVNKYVGLPAYANATDAALITVPSANTSGNNTNTIYYGVKVDTTLTPGTYSGDVLYTTLVTEACNNYTVHFDANGGSGSMSDQTIPVGTATNLTANAFSRSGYAFLGWATDKNVTTPTYVDKEKVTDLADFNSSTTLYAIWGFITGDMQTWTGCPALSTNAIVYLKDIRDENVYPIKKLADGKCWMVQNLRLVGEKKLTSADSNVSSDFTITASTADPNTTNWCKDNNATCDNKSQVYYNPSEASDGSKSSYYGALYNWHTATAGTGTYSLSYGNATSSICPKGWHLPKGGTGITTNEFSILDVAWGGTGGNRSSANTYDTFTGTYGTGNNGGFGLAGYISGYVDDVGSYGLYWSSTAYNSNFAYNLRLNKGNTRVGPQDGNYKHYGFAVRCLAQNNYTITYSSSGADSGEASKTEETAYESGSVTMPTVGTMKKDGYEFKGWALTSGASDPTYTAEQTVTVSALITATSSAGQATTPGSTITFYPVWEKSVAYMQDVSASDLTENATTTLRDSRDNQDYTVYRWPSTGTTWTDYPNGMAGYAIMTKDLSLGYVTGGSITKGSNLVLSTSDSAGSTTSSAPIYARTSKSNWATANSDSNLQYINGPSAAGNTYSTHSYYSYGAAQIVCPKGWRPPTKTEYGNIATFMGGNNSTGASKIIGAPYNFVLGGYFSSSDWSYVGGGGYYWSSQDSLGTYGHALDPAPSRLTTAEFDKHYGMSVRCVAEPPAEDCSETVHPTTTTGCKMKDDNIWILGNNGGATTWATSYTCPTGYSSPTKAVFDSLVSAQSSGSQLYSALGLSSSRYFWSTTRSTSNTSNAYRLYVTSSSAGIYNSDKTDFGSVLCYKQS